MSIENRIKELQTRLDLVAVYKIISNFKSLPFKKDYGIKKEVAEQVLARMRSWAEERVVELEKNIDIEDGPLEKVKKILEPPEEVKDENSLYFNQEEVYILKTIAQRFAQTNNIPEQPVPFLKEAVQSPLKNKPVDNKTFQKTPNKAQVIAVSNIEPEKIIDKICAYDVVRITTMDKKSGKCQVLKEDTGEAFTIPTEDLEFLS